MTDSNGLEQSLELTVMDGVALEATGRAGGKVKVTVYNTLPEQREVLHSDTYSKQFMENRTARGSIKNSVADALEDTSLDANSWKRAWKKKTSEVVAKGEQAQPELVPENVRMLAEGTKSVLTHRAGDRRIYNIKLEWDANTAELEFDHEDMASQSVQPLKNQCVLHFSKEPRLEPEDWQSLKDYWLEIQEEAGGETLTETDRKVESFVSQLKHRLTPYDSPDALANGIETAWVDWDNTHGVRIPGDDIARGVVWVKSELVSELLDSMDSAPPVGTLASELKKRGFTLRSSERLKPTPDTKARYWFFSTDELEITEMDVHSEERGDNPGTVQA